MATKKTTTAKKTDNIFNAFNDYRDRALSLGVVEDTKVTDKPFILTKEQGFKADIELPRPELRTRMVIEDAMQRRDTITFTRLVFGRHADTVLERLEEYEAETGQTAEPVLLGIVVAFLEHFYGNGAGSPAFPKA